MLIGYRLHIPCFFGKNFEIEKITRKAIPEGVQHKDILVSKQNPVQFFLLEVNQFESFLCEDLIENKIPVPLKEVTENNINGFAFSQYAIDFKLHGRIKELYKSNTFGHIIQLYASDDIIINLFFYKNNFYNEKNKKLKVSEVHMNPVFYSENLILANKSELYSDIDYSFFYSIENLVNQFNIKQNKKSEEYNGLLEFQQINKSLRLEDIYNSKNSPVNEYEFNFQRQFLNSYWLTVYEYNKNLNSFIQTCESPVITKKDKNKYLKKCNIDQNSYTASYDYFFPTFKDWHGNFPLNMVAVYFQTLREEDAINNHFRVSLTGNDDYAIYFVFDSFLFNKDSFLQFLSDKKVITSELVEELKKMAISFDY